MNKSNTHNNREIIFKIDGMHCVSCSMNIDGTLEDTQGVISSNTNFARSLTKIVFDSQKITIEKLKLLISEIGYNASEYSTS